MQAVVRVVVLISMMLLTQVVMATEKSPRAFQSIIESGELRVGVAFSPPWVMRAKDGQLIGAEIDMARRLAGDMGVAPRLALYDWDKIIEALERGEIDIIISGMTIKVDRALRVNFSSSYGDAGIGLAANTRMTAEFKSLDEINQSRVKVAAIADTVSADVAKRLFSNTSIHYFSEEEQLLNAILKGEVHAVIAASPLPEFWSLKYPGKIDTPLARPLLSFKEGFAINKGDSDFLSFLNAWIVARSADAWISSTRHYWLKTLEWQDQVLQQ